MALELAAEQLPKVIVLNERCYLIGFPLEGIGPSRHVALGVVDALARTGAERDQEQSRLGKWARSVHVRLRGAREISDHRRSQAERDRQSMLAWEVTKALERLHGSLRIHKEPARNRGRILRFAGELLGVSSLAWVSRLEDGEVVLEGDQLLSPWECGQLAKQLADQNLGVEPGYVLVNDARETPWAAAFSPNPQPAGHPRLEESRGGCWRLTSSEPPAAARPTGASPGAGRGTRRIRAICGRAVRAAGRGDPDAFCLPPRVTCACRPTVSLHQGCPGRADALADRRDRCQG